MIPCGCYYGGDCDKTTVCAIESAVEDANEEISILKSFLKESESLMLDAIFLLQTAKAGQCANETAANMNDWLRRVEDEGF
jgi:hypothetical protein